MASLDKTLLELTNEFRRERRVGLQELVKLRDLMAAGPVSANAIRHSLMNYVRDVIAKVNVMLTDIAILEPYIRDQIGNQTFDLLAYLNEIMTSSVIIRDRIINTVPTDAGGFMLIDSFEADGSITVRTFTPVQTTQLRADIDRLLAAL